MPDNSTHSAFNRLLGVSHDDRYSPLSLVFGFLYEDDAINFKRALLSVDNPTCTIVDNQDGSAEVSFWDPDNEVYNFNRRIPLNFEKGIVEYIDKLIEFEEDFQIEMVLLDEMGSRLKVIDTINRSDFAAFTITNSEKS